MKEFLSKHIDFSEEEFESFMSIAKIQEYKKNDYLLNADRPVRKLFFCQIWSYAWIQNTRWS